MSSRATIKVEPQHIPPEIKKVHYEANFDFGNGPRPNDIHIYIRPLSAFDGDWTKKHDGSYHAGVMPLPYKFQFPKPDEPGTYDIRVVFTHNGEPMKDGERNGQFFVD